MTAPSPAPVDPKFAPKAEDTPTITLLNALRWHFANNLGLPPRLVGGWEMIAMRDATLAVYANGGGAERGPGSVVTRQDEDVQIVFMTRSGSPIDERLLYPVRDALIELLSRFHHPLLAGIGRISWKFDLRKDTTFTNVLTITAAMKGRTAPVKMQGKKVDLIGVAAQVIANLTQISQTEEEPQP